MGVGVGVGVGDNPRMPHIDLGVDSRMFPGLAGLTQYRPETARPLLELAEILLRGPNSLSRGEGELIASYVSARNDCLFCASAHAAFAAAQLDEGMPLVEQVRCDLDRAPVTDKLRELLRIAAAVQEGGKNVSAELVDAARAEGASDVEIHDTVLIAAAFCMFNRYVDGLATFAPEDPAGYAARADRIINYGYLAMRPG